MSDPSSGPHTNPVTSSSSLSQSQSDLQSEVANLLAHLIRSTSAPSPTPSRMEEGSAGYSNLSRGHGALQSQLKGSDDHCHRGGAEDEEVSSRPPASASGPGGLGTNREGAGAGINASTTRMSERIHGSGSSSTDDGDGDVQALTLMLTNRLGSVVQEAAGQLAEAKQRLAREHEEAMARALKDHQQQVVELKAYVGTLHDELQQLQFKSQEAQRKSEVTRDRLVARLFTRGQRDAIQSAFQQWRWAAWASVSIRRAQEHAAGQLEKHRHTSRAWLTWAREQAQAKIQQLEANQKSQADQIVREVVRKYEEELNRLRQMLAMKDEELTLEVKRREHLQDEARRAFLKTMTSLNLEAISMFGGNGASSPGTSSPIPHGHNHGHPPGQAPSGHSTSPPITITRTSFNEGHHILPPSAPPAEEREKPRPPLMVQPMATSSHRTPV